MLIGFETGSYAEPFSNFLRKKPVKLVQVHTKRIKELTQLSKQIDKKDPRVIEVIALAMA